MLPSSLNVAFILLNDFQDTFVPFLTAFSATSSISSFVVLLSYAISSIATPIRCLSSSIAFVVSFTIKGSVFAAGTASSTVPHLSVRVAETVPFTVLDDLTILKFALSSVIITSLLSVASIAIFKMSVEVVSFETSKVHIASLIAFFAAFMYFLAVASSILPSETSSFTGSLSPSSVVKPPNALLSVPAGISFLTVSASSPSSIKMLTSALTYPAFVAVGLTTLKRSTKNPVPTNEFVEYSHAPNKRFSISSLVKFTSTSAFSSKSRKRSIFFSHAVCASSITVMAYAVVCGVCTAPSISAAAQAQAKNFFITALPFFIKNICFFTTL